MSEHLSTERIHDLIDGLLPSSQEDAARAHMEVCATCRETHARLAELVVDLRAMPREARVPEGLWAGIQSRMEGVAPGGAADAAGQVVAFPSTRRGRRRFTFTVPQLAAAAVVVSVLSAGTVWMALSLGTAAGPAASAATSAPLPGSGPAARMASTGTAAYDQAVLELQAIVDEGRRYLAPETLAVLDRSLQTINDALAEIRQALAADPGNELLARMLVRQQASKLRVLRQAATAVQGRS